MLLGQLSLVRSSPFLSFQKDQSRTNLFVFLVVHGKLDYYIPQKASVNLAQKSNFSKLWLTDNKSYSWTAPRRLQVLHLFCKIPGKTCRRTPQFITISNEIKSHWQGSLCLQYGSSPAILTVHSRVQFWYTPDNGGALKKRVSNRQNVWKALPYLMP